MNRKSITLVVVVVLCIVVFAFNKGWFSSTSPTPAAETSKVSANQMLDHDKSTGDAVQVTQKIAKPAATATH